MGDVYWEKRDWNMIVDELLREGGMCVCWLCPCIFGVWNEGVEGESFKGESFKGLIRFV